VTFPIAIPDGNNAGGVSVKISAPLGLQFIDKLSLCLGLTHSYFGAQLLGQQGFGVGWEVRAHLAGMKSTGQ